MLGHQLLQQVQPRRHVGRGEDRWPERIDLLTAGDSPRMVIPVVRFDPDAARQGLAALAALPLLFAWRKAYREGRLGLEAPSFYPVQIDGVEAHAGDGGAPPEPPENGSASPVEIVLRTGRRMIVRSDIAPVVLGHLLDVVDR